MYTKSNRVHPSLCHRFIRRKLVLLAILLFSPIGYALGIRLWDEPAAPSVPYTVEVGRWVSLSLAWPLSGEEPDDLQWYHNGNPIAGATADTLILNSATPAQAGNYEVRTADDRSNIITINVHPPQSSLVFKTFNLPHDGSTYELVHVDRSGEIYVLARREDGNHLLEIAHVGGAPNPSFDIPLGRGSPSVFVPLGDDRFLITKVEVTGSFDVLTSTFISDGAGAVSPVSFPYDVPIEDAIIISDESIYVSQNLHALTGNYRHVISHLNPDGTLDANYTGATSRPGVIYDLMAVGDDNFVAVILDPGNQSNRRWRIERYALDGSPYPGFSTYYSPDIIRLHTALPHGQILFGTEHESEVFKQTLQRLNSNGALDTAAGSVYRRVEHPIRATTDGTMFERVQTVVDGTSRWQLQIFTLPGDPAPTAPFDNTALSVPFTFLIRPNASLFLVGDFTSYAGVPTSHAVGLDGTYRYEPQPPPASVTVEAHTDPTTFAVTTVTLATPPSPTPDTSFTWLPLDGQTGFDVEDRHLVIDEVTADSAGRYQLLATNPVGSTYSRIIEIPAVAPPPRLVNLSARTLVPANDQPATLGFVSTDVPIPGVPAVLFRGVGPGLAPFLDSTTITVTDPHIRLLDGHGALLAENDKWKNVLWPLFNATGAFPFEWDSADAALVHAPPAGRATLQLLSKTPEPQSVALLEAFTTSPSPNLINLSIRATAGSGDHSLVAGFTLGAQSDVASSRPAWLLIRAIGPGLADHGIPDALSDPRLRLFNTQNELVSENDHWESMAPAELTAAMQTVGAFNLEPGSQDAALLVDLPAGAYTAVVETTGEVQGTVLLEIYVVD